MRKSASWRCHMVGVITRTSRWRGKELSKNTDTQVHLEEGELTPVSAVKYSRGPTYVR